MDTPPSKTEAGYNHVTMVPLSLADVMHGAERACSIARGDYIVCISMNMPMPIAGPNSVPSNATITDLANMTRPRNQLQKPDARAPP